MTLVWIVFTAAVITTALLMWIAIYMCRSDDDDSCDGWESEPDNHVKNYPWEL